ncbi:hypothetical protein K2X89_02510 [Myxococcota bacterium]|nr:hypothetical protein [Myxococcota bacterium]
MIAWRGRDPDLGDRLKSLSARADGDGESPIPEPAMPPTAYLAPFVEPLALLVRDWQADGKLDEDDLERAL